MAARRNPYIAGNPVGNLASFVGRTDILRETKRVLDDPYQNAITLHGQRRIVAYLDGLYPNGHLRRAKVNARRVIEMWEE